MINDYFQKVLKQIDSFPYTESSNVGMDERSEAVGYIRGDVIFLDGSRLHLRELVNLNKGGKIKYIYHFQRADGALVFRYDNAPHHKHTGIENVVASAAAPELSEILDEIESLLQLD